MAIIDLPPTGEGCGLNIWRLMWKRIWRVFGLLPQTVSPRTLQLIKRGWIYAMP